MMLGDFGFGVRSEDSVAMILVSSHMCVCVCAGAGSGYEGFTLNP